MGRILRPRGRAYVVLTAAILATALVISAALLRREPAPPAEPAPGHAETGALLITSEPDGALVWVDGEERGITPLRVRDLAEGRHRVHLEKEGFTPLASGVAEFAFGAERAFHGVLSPVAPAAAAGDDGPAPRAARARGDMPGLRRGAAAGDPVVVEGRKPPMRAVQPLPEGAAQDAVDLALAWLAAHQHEDGHWDADGFHARCRLNECTGPGDGAHDVGVTGLSLLAFLGAGETHNTGEHTDTLKRGLRYLKSVQDAEGCFADKSDVLWMYDHLAATLAMVEAYGLTGSRLFKEPAQRGVSFVHKAQNPYLAWRYGVRDGDNDTSVTAWAVWVLKAAQMAELEVDPGAFRGAVAWIDKMTDPELGRVGYQRRGGSPARMQDMMDRFPADQVETLTAMGVLVRVFAGQDPARNEFILKGAELLLDKPPKWTGPRGSTDFTYWLFGSAAMYQVGGRHWKEWNEHVADAVVRHQRVAEGRDDLGSWDPVDPWSTVGGRVYATAVNCMTLEMHYRYARLSDGR